MCILLDLIFLAASCKVPNVNFLGSFRLLVKRIILHIYVKFMLKYGDKGCE